MQKFNGKNKYNNLIVVDFIKQNVSFVPLKGNGTFKTPSLISGHLQEIIFYVFLYHVGIGLFLERVIPKFQLNFVTLFTWPVVAYLLSYLIGLIFDKLDKNRKYFPSVMVLCIMLLRGLKGKMLFNKVIITPPMINNNFVEIDQFDNVIFKYVLNGDFVDAISKINIYPVKVYDPYRWIAKIEFKRTPRDGSMTIKYI